MKWFCLVVLIFGAVLADNDVEDRLKVFREQFAGGNQLVELQDAVSEKCKKNGGEEAFGKLRKSIIDLSENVEANFNATSIEAEINESKKRGAMDEVFSKYCGKVPEVKTFVAQVVTNLGNCMQESERPSLHMLVNITESLVDFICFKDGDRIAMFIAEDGPECIESQREKLEACYTDVFNEVDFSELSLDTLPNLTTNTEGCGTYNKLQRCVVQALENCSDSTPANIVEALFRFIRRQTPCKNVKA